MSSTALSFSRRHVLGDLHAKCEAMLEPVPVYLAGEEKELLGHADEGLGHYADAFTFHLPDDVCKRLASGQYTFEFDLDHSEKKGKFILRSILLKMGKPYEKPLPSRRATS